ncbi:unnamed protein product [Amoebophrya sp. A25]|nr:unnamed protein product [Amoebophrya sp. A25]|eukprot:GSA25T00011458001.1
MDGAGGCGGGSEISDEELGTESEFEPKRRKLAPSSPISDVEKENEDDEIRSEVGEESGSSPEEVAAALSHVRGGSQSPPRILSQGQGGSRFPHGTPRSRMRQLSPPAAPEGGLGLSSASSSPLCRDKDTARRHLGDYDDDEPKADDEGENDGEQEAPHHGGDMNATTSLISRSSVFSSKKAYLNDERDEDEIMEQEMKAHLRSAPALSCTDRQRDADELSKNASVRDTDKDQQVKSNISDDHHDEDAVFKSEDLRKGSCHVEDHRTDAPSKSCRGSTFSTTSSVNMPARRNSNNKASSTSKAAVAERATNCSSGASSSSSSSRKKQPSMCGSKAETAGPQAPSLRIQEPTSASGVGILHARTTTLLSPGLMNGRASGPLVKKADTIEEAYIMSLPCADDEDDEGRIGSPTTFRPAPAKGQGIEPSCSSMDLTAGRAEAAAANRTSGQQKPVTETTSRTALSGGGVSFAPAAATTIDAQASPQEAKSTFFGSSSSTSTSSSGASSTLGAVGGLFNRIWNWAFPVVGRKRQRAEDAAPDEQPSSWTTGDAASSSAQRADNENFLASATSRASSSLVVQPSTSLMDIDADESGKAAMITKTCLSIIPAQHQFIYNKAASIHLLTWKCKHSCYVVIENFYLDDPTLQN